MTDGFDVAAWILENAEDNSEMKQRLKRNLSRAMEEELTAHQRQVVQMYYFNRQNTAQIADVLGISASTVSRTLGRAKRRLYRALKYSF